MSFAVSLVQMEVESLAKDHNWDKMEGFVRQEAQAGARLIVFPELSNTGYVAPFEAGQALGMGFKRYGDYARALWQAAEPLQGDNMRRLSMLAQELDVFIVAGLAVYDERVPTRLFNSSVLFGPAEGELAVYHKMHLWGTEKLYFARGEEISVHQLPIGTLGMQVCYDIRFPELTRIMALQGAEIITNVWASAYPKDSIPADMGLFVHRCFTRAHENGVYFLSCNQAGSRGDYQFLGHSVVCGPDGNVQAELANFDEGVVRAELDLQKVRDYRASVPLFADRQADLYRRYFQALDKLPG